ncbi:Uncharacterised protein [Segatella copri]|nr:Uncharacterised protein [Segatella copri]
MISQEAVTQSGRLVLRKSAKSVSFRTDSCDICVGSPCPA